MTIRKVKDCKHKKTENSKMSNTRSTSPSVADNPPILQIQELTPPPIKKSVAAEGDVAVSSPRLSSPSKHSRGRHNLRLAWAKSSNFRNTLNVPHGGSTHSVCSGSLIFPFVYFYNF